MSKIVLNQMHADDFNTCYEASPCPSGYLYRAITFGEKYGQKIEGPSNSVHKRTKNNNQKLKSEETNTNANPNATNKYFRLRLNIILCGVYQN